MTRDSVQRIAASLAVAAMCVGGAAGAQDSAHFEDPLARAVGPVNSAAIASRVSSADTTIIRTFGVHRCDALYLLPLTAVTSEAAVLVDFATHRRGFRVGLIGATLPPALAYPSVLQPPLEEPPAAAVWPLVRREYPDLASLLAPKP